MKRFAPFLLVLTILCGITYAASNTLTVTRADDMLQFNELKSLDAFNKLKNAHARYLSLQSQTAAALAYRNSIGDKLRANLVRYGENRDPALDLNTSLPAQLWDVEVDESDPVDGTEIYWNEAADTFRTGE